LEEASTRFDIALDRVLADPSYASFHAHREQFTAVIKSWSDFRRVSAEDFVAAGVPLGVAKAVVYALSFLDPLSDTSFLVAVDHVLRSNPQADEFREGVLALRITSWDAFRTLTVCDLVQQGISRTSARCFIANVQRFDPQATATSPSHPGAQLVQLSVPIAPPPRRTQRNVLTRPQQQEKEGPRGLWVALEYGHNPKFVRLKGVEDVQSFRAAIRARYSPALDHAAAESLEFIGYGGAVLNVAPEDTDVVRVFGWMGLVMKKPIIVRIPSKRGAWLQDLRMSLRILQQSLGMTFSLLRPAVPSVSQAQRSLELGPRA